MSFRHTLLAAALLLYFIAPIAPVWAAEPLTISGQILDAEGQPFEGGRVDALPAPDRALLGRWLLGLEAAPAPTATGATDADGLFRLTVPSVGPWRLRVTGSGHLQQEDTVPVTEPLELGALRLTRSESRQVTVVDSAGRPVAGARVTVFGGLGAIARTGADGRAAVELPRTVPENEVLVVPPLGPSLSATLRGTGLRVVLPDNGAPAPLITVQDAAGRPVPQAVFWFWGQPTTVTDTQGRGYLPTLPGRSETPFEIVANGRWTGRATTGRPPERLTPPVRLNGRVRTPTGAPVPDALVWPVGHPGEFALTNAEGRFELLASAPPRRSLELLAVAAGYVATRAEIAPGGAAADLRLTPAARVSGQVVDAEGHPQAGFSVTAESSTDRPADVPPPRFRTGADGRFRLTGLTPGETYTLRAVRSEVARGELSLKPLRAAEARADLRLQVTPFRAAKGRVVDAAGDAIEGALATLASIEDAPDFFGSNFAQQSAGPYRRESDRTGRFRIPGLEPGRYDLRVRAPGFAAVTVRGLTIPAKGTEVDLGTVHLSPAATLRGRVVDGNETPIADAEVTFLANQSSFVDVRLEEDPSPLFTDAEGAFVIPDLSPGTSLALNVTHPGYVPGDLPGVRVPRDEELVITLLSAGRITGHVVDGDGRGIEAAQVVTSESRSDGAATDASGAFTLEGLTPGTVELEADAHGYLHPPIKTVEVRAGEDVADVVFQLERGASLVGRLTGPSGAPVDEGHVFLRDFSGYGTQFARTDEDGNYLLEGVPLGERRFSAGAEGLLEAIRTTTVRAGENRLDFRLERGLAIRGRVVGPEGQAVDQGEVMATADPDGSSQERGAIRPDGSFEIINLKPGRYRLRADTVDFAPGEAPDLATVGPGSVEGVVITLRRGAKIVGRVQGLGFDDLAELQVVATLLDGSQYSPGQVDYQGGFVIKNVTPGSWTVIAVAGSRQAIERADVEPGVAETRVDIEFGDGFTLSGRVTRGGRAVVNASVLASQPQQLAGGYASTDHDGRFEVLDLQPGEYQVAVATTWNGFAHTETVSLDGDRDITIELVGLTVSGRVLTADGDPLPSAKVNLRGTDSDGLGGWGSERATDEAGQFRFTDVAPGQYRLQGQKEGYAQSEVAVEVTEGDAEADLRLSPSPALVLELQTVRGPLATGTGVAVAAVDNQGRVVYRGNGEADERGRVQLASVPVGSWTLWLTTRGQALTHFPVTSPGPAIPVALTPGGELQIEVPTLRTSSALARLTLIGPDGQLLPTLHQGLELDYQRQLLFGQGSVGEVPPGRWTLRVATPSGETLEKTVDVAAGPNRVLIE